MLDQHQLERLYGELERPLFNLALRWTWNRAVAQELVQDAFMKLWTRRRFVRAETSAAYLYKTALNLCRNHARRRSAWRGVLQRLPGLGRPVDPEQDYEQGRLRGAIEALPDGQREVLLLCEYTHLTHREIAVLLGIPTGTVGSRRNLALRKLKEELADAAA